MTPAELDHELKELETRLERVRALYEQYFMGIERIEPAVPRKDLDRRIQTLRKIRFQNTAKRFKFQTIIQRYNSLQQYWNRTCRDIENGTYRKHLQRAKRRFGEDDAQPTKSAEETKEDNQERAAQAANARDAAAADLGAMLDADMDLDAELKSALSEVKASPAPTLGKLNQAPAPKRTGTSPSPKALGKAPPPKRTATSPAPKGLSALKPSSPKDGDASKRSPGASPARTATSPGVKGLAGLGSRTGTSPKPLAPLPRAKTEAGAKPTAPKPGAPRPAAPRPAAPKPAAPRPAAPRPAAPKPAAPRPVAPRAAASLSDDRIKNLHASYVDARKKTNASAVSYEKLEKSIRDTERKLRAKHKGRNVDFDVSIQGGKAILKPKLK